MPFPDASLFGTEDYTGSDVGPISTSDPAYQAMLAGNSPSTSTPAQGSTTGASLFGWLSLASNVAATAVNASRSGATSRPLVNRPATSLGSFGGVTTTTLLVIVAVFIGVIFLLRK